MDALRSLLARPRKALQPLVGAGTAFLQWPTKPQVLLIAAATVALFGMLGAGAFISFRWHAQAAAKEPAGREILARLDQAADLQRQARKLGQDYVFNGRAESQQGQLAGLDRLAASLAGLKPLVAGTGDLAATVERLIGAVGRQAPLARLLERARLAEARKRGGGDPVEDNAPGLAAASAEAEENYSRLADLCQEAREEQKDRLDQWAWEAQTATRGVVLSLLLGELLALAFIGGSVRSMTYYIEREDLSSGSLKHIQSFMNSTSEAVYGIDLEGRCTFCNRAFLRLLGLETASQLLGRRVQGLVFGDDGGADGGPVLAALRQGKGLNLPEVLVRTADGKPVAVECRSSPVYEEEALVGAAVTLVDLSGPRKAQQALQLDHAALVLQVRDLSQRSEEIAQFGQLAEMLQACVSTDELCRLVALAAEELFPDVAGALYVLEPLDQTLVPRINWGDPALQAKASFPLQDCWAIRRGKPHYLEQARKDVFCGHTAGPPLAFSFCLPLGDQVGAHGLLNLRAAAGGAVLSERRQLVAVALAYQVASGLSNLRLKEILREEAIRDPVTGLFNRRFMKESLEHELQRALRNHGSVGVISFDLDHFKGVNDTLGHAAGDALLVAVAHLARESLRAVDICCRQGGDEFLLILLDANPADVLRLAEGLRAGVEKLSREIYPGLMAPVTLSAGVALSPQDAATAEGLQKAADRALYRAKSLGRNRVFAASGLEPAARAA